MDPDVGNSTQTTTQTSNCAGCDVGGQKCSIERYKRQAAVAEEMTQALSGFQEKFDKARTTYTKARADAEADVKWSQRILYGKGAEPGETSVKERLKCLTDSDQRDCLKDSLATVAAAIKECSGTTTTGCCVGDCDYPHAETPGETASSLAGLIAQFRGDAQKNQDCFNSLIDLATNIPKGTADLRAAVAKLDEESKSATRDNAVRLFAEYLVLRHRLSGGGLFGGFKDVNAYMDCLCKALQCSYLAWEAVIDLEGRRAYLECQDKAKQDECERKKKEILEDLLCEYEKCKPDSDPDPTHDDDCGCGQHPKGSQQQSA
jgi:hypothetical protein